METHVNVSTCRPLYPSVHAEEVFGASIRSSRARRERTVALGSTTTRRLVNDQRLSFDYKHTNAALVEPSALNEGDDFDIFAGVRVSRFSQTT